MFVTPSPRGVSALDVKHELGDWQPVGRHEEHCRTDAAVGGLPWLRVLIEDFQQPELVVKQRPYFSEPGRRPDLMQLFELAADDLCGPVTSLRATSAVAVGN